MSYSFIERFTPPTKLDYAEHGTICHVKTETGLDIYVQTSKDEEKPSWKALSRVFERALTEFIGNKRFMEEVFFLYDKNKRDPIGTIIDILANKQNSAD